MRTVRLLAWQRVQRDARAAESGAAMDLLLGVGEGVEGEGVDVLLVPQRNHHHHHHQENDGRKTHHTLKNLNLILIWTT